MLTLGELSPDQLRARLAGPGIDLETGPFVCRVKSDIEALAEGLASMYPNYRVREPDGFADFHLAMRHSGGLRRFLGRQVQFDHDGHAPFRPLPVDQAFPMFEWAMNWCVSSRAHAYLIIHAAVIERDGCAVILPAPPGSGKSTLCAALVSRGWRLLSDELTLVRLSDGMLVPLPRPISLKNASIDVMQSYAPQMTMSRPVKDTNKGTVAHLRPPPQSVARGGEAVAPAWIIFPKYAAGAALEMSELAPARAFMQVADNAFNYSLLGARGFDALGRLIAASRSASFRYGVLDEAMAAFDALARGRA
ncbi:MAG: HprK-related kinase A [Pseudomonadota bacterium]